MKKQMSSTQSPGPDDREIVRAESLRVGKMPVVKKDQVVWVWFTGRWQKARVRRPMPGGVYMTELITYPCNGTLTTVSANTFGGIVKAARS